MSPLTPPRTASRSLVAMDTLVTARAEGPDAGDVLDAALRRALAWFPEVERVCSRFDPDSELSRLCARPGETIAAGPLLFEALAFALDVAAVTGGAFDPTAGAAQQARGFRRNYRDGQQTPDSGQGEQTAARAAGYRAVRLDRRRRTVTLARPLLLDLGAVAKGLAVDLAARELAGMERYAVEAGGDLFAGAAPGAEPWRIGVRDPRGDGLLGTLSLRNLAVCSSGGDERPAPAATDGEHHIIDPRSGRSPRAVSGVTVIAPAAMTADALATAAMVLGPVRGVHLLDEQGVAGIVVPRQGVVRFTRAFPGAMQWSPILA